MADNNLNPMEQKVYDVSSNDNPANYNQMARLWGEHYQTEQDPTKMAKFQAEMDAPVNETLQNLASIGSSAFSFDETGMSPEDFSKLLYHTGFHESGAISGQPQMSQGYYDNSGNWVSEGPAGSYFQVEPKTLKSLVTAVQPSGATNPSKRYWGDAAAEASGITHEQLYGMSIDELSALLRDPKRQNIGAVAAGAKYAQSLNNPVNQTMDAYNKTEDIYK